MSEFSIEFLPHYAGNIKRNATFSLYEASWNHYGRWGIFELQINIPHLIHRVDTLQLKDRIMRYVGDMSAEDNYGKWDEKRLALYRQYKNQVLLEIPAEIHFRPYTSLCWRLLANFTYEDREEIAHILHFKFYNQNDKEIYFSKLPLKKAIENGDLPIIAERF